MPTLPGQVTGRASIPFEVRLARKVTAQGSCLLWTGARNRDGYGEMTLAGRRSLVHRLVYEHYVGPIPEGMVVMHACDNPACVMPPHLKLGTHADNQADKASKGRAAAKSRNGAARLTDERYDELERRAAAGEPQNRIAADLGVSPQAVSQYLKRRKVTG